MRGILSLCYWGFRRIVKNELLQRNVILSKEDVELINRIEGQFYPEKDYDPYQVNFGWDGGFFKKGGKN